MCLSSKTKVWCPLQARLEVAQPRGCPRAHQGVPSQRHLWREAVCIPVLAGAAPEGWRKAVSPLCWVIWPLLSLLWQERRPWLCPPWAGQPLTGGSPTPGRGTAGTGWWEQQDRPQGAAPSLELMPIPVAGSWSCCPPKQLHSLHSLHLHLRGAFPKAWRGVPVTSLAASWCPAVLLTLPRRPSVRPSPPCPSTPISPSGTRCHLWQLPPLPAPAASHPHPFHHDLVLGYFGKHRGPPVTETPPLFPLWVLLLVVLSPPGRSLWFGAVPKMALMALKLHGGDFPWAGEGNNPWTNPVCG